MWQAIGGGHYLIMSPLTGLGNIIGSVFYKYTSPTGFGDATAISNEIVDQESRFLTRLRQGFRLRIATARQADGQAVGVLLRGFAAKITDPAMRNPKIEE
jgi:hypothetical protein